MSIGRLFLTRVPRFMIKMYPYNTINIDADSSIISEVAMRQILDIIEDTSKILSDPLNDIRRPMWLNMLDKNSRRINIPHIVIKKNDVEKVKELIPYSGYLNLSPEDKEFLEMTEQPETMRWISDILKDYPNVSFTVSQEVEVNGSKTCNRSRGDDQEC